MFKDFGRRLQRDLKKIVDARVVSFESRLNEEVKVSILDAETLLSMMLSSSIA